MLIFMRLPLALALLLLPGSHGSAGGALALPNERPGDQGGKPDLGLIRLERELDEKLKAPKLDRASPEYREFSARFRARLDAALERAGSASVNRALYAQLLARLGGDQSRQAADSLKAGLKSDPEDHALRAALGIVEYERKNYREAAAQAKALLNPDLNPAPSQDVLEKARALWFMTKDRGDGQSSSVPPMPARVARPAPEATKASEINFTPPVRRKTTGAPPAPADAPDPAWEAARAGRETLEKSALGRDVLAYARGQGVRFELSDMPPNVGAQYDGDRKLILLPRDIAARNPVEAAVFIGHEAFHARQHLRDGMIASIESEQDGSFADRVIYHELLKAGENPLPRGNITEENYRIFAGQVRYQDFAKFNIDVAKQYSDAREMRLSQAVDKAPAFLRGALRWSLETVDADFLRAYETLDDQEKKLWNFLEKPAIRSARKEHRIEQAWQLKWMKEHQRDFPPPVWPH